MIGLGDIVEVDMDADLTKVSVGDGFSALLSEMRAYNVIILKRQEENCRLAHYGAEGLKAGTRAPLWILQLICQNKVLLIVVMGLIH